MIMRSMGKRPSMMKSTSCGMNTCGWLAPWMMPRTVRPNWRNGISRETSVPLRALPTPERRILRQRRQRAVELLGRRHRAARGAADDGNVAQASHGAAPVEAHPRAGDLLHLAHDICSGAIVQHVRRAELARKYEALGMDINGDDRITACDLGRHQC